jgi:V/A-type H+/Na+-transporting ATPase subunit G/H
LSGIEAVRRIVETEAQAKRIVEEARTRAREILENTSEEAQKIRQTAISQAEKRKAQLLVETRDQAETDAKNSDMETDSQLESFEKLFRGRKEAAVKKAVDLILGG